MSKCILLLVLFFFNVHITYFNTFNTVQGFSIYSPLNDEEFIPSNLGKSPPSDSPTSKNKITAIHTAEVLLPKDPVMDSTKETKEFMPIENLDADHHNKIIENNKIENKFVKPQVYQDIKDIPDYKLNETELKEKYKISVPNKPSLWPKKANAEEHEKKIESKYTNKYYTAKDYINLKKAVQSNTHKEDYYTPDGLTLKQEEELNISLEDLDGNKNGSTGSSSVIRGGQTFTKYKDEENSSNSNNPNIQIATKNKFNSSSSGTSSNTTSYSFGTPSKQLKYTENHSSINKVRNNLQESQFNQNFKDPNSNSSSSSYIISSRKNIVSVLILISLIFLLL